MADDVVFHFQSDSSDEIVAMPGGTSKTDPAKGASGEPASQAAGAENEAESAHEPAASADAQAQDKVRTLPMMYVTTDAVAFSVAKQEGLCVLLVKRSNPPFQGCWALPGGFVEPDEDLDVACRRELMEETGVKATVALQLGAWGKPGRDPRGRNVTVAFLMPIRSDEAKISAGSDATDAQWHPVDDLPDLAFDHAEIITAGLRRLRSLAAATHFVFSLIPERFTMTDLCDALAAVRNELVTDNETFVFAKRCRVAKLPKDLPRDPDRFRCVTPDYLLRLRT